MRRLFKLLAILIVVGSAVGAIVYRHRLPWDQVGRGASRVAGLVRRQLAARARANSAAKDATDDSPPAEPRTGPLVCYSLQAHADSAALRRGVQAFARETGGKVDFRTNTDGRQETEDADCLALADGACRGLAVDPANTLAVGDLFGRLKRKGLPVVAVGAEPSLPTPVPLTIATSAKAVAHDATEELRERLGGHGRLLELLSDMHDPLTQRLSDAIHAAVADRKGLSIGQTLGDLVDVASGVTRLKELLASPERGFDAVVAAGPLPSLVAARALAGGAKGQLPAIGLGANAETLAAVRAGTLDGVFAENPFGQGYVAMTVLDLLSQGWQPRREYMLIDSGTVLVTKANLDKYEQSLRHLTDGLLADLKGRYLMH